MTSSVVCGRAAAGRIAGQVERWSVLARDLVGSEGALVAGSAARPVVSAAEGPDLILLARPEGFEAPTF